MAASLGCIAILQLAATATSVASPGRAVPYRENPPVAHTGGFGEPTCRVCHFDGPLDPPGGELEVEGLPPGYEPGRTYPLTITLRHPELEAGGFELAVRFAEPGSAARTAPAPSLEPPERGQAGLPPGPAGTQAGTLAPVDGRVAISEGPESPGAPPVQYAHHSVAGLEPTGPGVATWTIEWTAPSTTSGSDEVDDRWPGRAAPVVLHLMANAANDDVSEFGDRIYALVRSSDAGTTELHGDRPTQ